MDNTTDFGFSKYISGAKAKPKSRVLEDEVIKAPRLPSVELEEYRAPQVSNLPVPDFTVPKAPDLTVPQPRLQIKPTPKTQSVNIPQDVLTPPNMSLTAPEITAPKLEVFGAPVSEQSTTVSQGQSVVPKQSFVQKPEQSPTAADKEFYKPVPIKGNTLELPAEWKEEDVKKVEEMAKKYGTTKEEMFGLMYHETGGEMSPKTKNPQGATGLIQFVPETAADLLLTQAREKAISEARQQAKEQNLSGKEATKLEFDAKRKYRLYNELSDNEKAAARASAARAIENMSVSQQLDLKDYYLNKRTKGTKGIDNIYTSIFAGNPNETYIPAGTKAYNSNKVLDKDGKGGITREEWLAPVLEKSKKISEVVLAKPKANTASYNPSKGGFKITDEQKDNLYDEAVNVTALANPQIRRGDILRARDGVPLVIAAPKSKEQEVLKGAGRAGENAAGLYYGSPGSANEKIVTTTSIPRDAAMGVVAHELGHAVGLEESETPGDLQYYKSAEDFINAPNIKREVVTSALREGGRKLNQERYQLMNWAPWLPYELVKRIVPKPSDAFDLDRMEEASGKGKQKTWKD